MLTLSKSLQPLAKHLLLQDKSGDFFTEKSFSKSNKTWLLRLTRPAQGSFHFPSYYLFGSHKWKMSIWIKILDKYIFKSFNSSIYTKILGNVLRTLIQKWFWHHSPFYIFFLFCFHFCFFFLFFVCFFFAKCLNSVITSHNTQFVCISLFLIISNLKHYAHWNLVLSKFLNGC